jgi:SOS response regulatory protein OraA/RecX
MGRLGSLIPQSLRLLIDLLTGKLGRLPQIGAILTYIFTWVETTARNGGPGSADIRDLKATGVPEQALVAAPVALAFGGIFAVKNAIQAVYETILQKYTRAQNARLRLAILSPSETAAAVIQSYWERAKGILNLANYGYTDEDANTLIDIQGEPLAPGQLLDLLNRGEADEAFVRQGLNESRLKPKYNDYLLKLRFQLLGASDYIRFAVREVFTPSARAALTLDEDYPEILTQKLRRIGYSEEDARDSWAAHWELPSPTQVYEMLHRGLITEKQLDDYLRSADYAPVWRPLLKAISYDPLTRVDVRRAYKLGVVTLEQVKQTYRDIGYDERNAQILTDFTREDADEERRQEKELLVGPVKSSALAMYKARRIGEAQLRQTLANLGYPKEIVDRFVADIDFTREQDRREDVANALKASYVKALRSRDDTIAILTKAGYNDLELAQLMETWDILREATELQPHQSAQRDLTKGEILQAYSDDVYDEAQTRLAIAALGYDDAETSAIVGHAVLVKSKKALSDEIEVIHQETIAGGRTFDDAAIALDKLRVPATQKRLYLIRWGQERQKRIPDFPVALLEKLAAKNLLTTDAARFYLVNQGYTEQQIGLLLALWDTNRADKEAALAARRARGMTTNAPN